MKGSIRLESLLYAALFVLALWIRVINLDWPPLTEAEAQAAIAADSGVIQIQSTESTASAPAYSFAGDTNNPGI